MTKKDTNKKTVAEIVTQRFIDALEGGAVPWVKPWDCWSSWSRNTGNDYQGANLLTLSGGEYVTFKQAKEEGIQIQKGAKSEMIVKYTEYMRKLSAEEWNREKGRYIWDDAAGKVEHLSDGGAKVPARSIRYYNVFNVAECTDAENKHNKKLSAHDWDAIEKAEEITAAYTGKYNITVEHLGNRAFNADAILDGGHVQLPKRVQFISAEGYYSTFFHELVHSTAAHVNRDKSQYHASKKARAREELVAEIGAAYIMSYLGIESGFSIANSEAYVKDWAETLKSDPNAILWAAPKAIEAAEFILAAAGIKANQ